MEDLFEWDTARLRAALLQAVENYQQVADFLAHNENADLDIQCFYFTLIVRCLGLKQLLAEEKDLHSIRKFLCEALKLLESFIVAPIRAICGSRYPLPGLATLHRLLIIYVDTTSRLEALQGFIDLGSKEERVALLELLHNGCTIVQSQAHIDIYNFELAPPENTRQKPPGGIRVAANSLFRVLKAKRGCNCEPIHRYMVQLSLGTHRAQIESWNFDLCFGLEQVWQEARVQTNDTSISNKHHTGMDASHIPVKRQDRRRPVDKLCKEIKDITRKFPDRRLKFSLERDDLWKHQSEENHFVIDKTKAPISLTQLLAEDGTVLNDRIKRILSVLLSYAILHLHETSWLSPTWGSCDVMFFRSSDGLPMRPYLRNQLSNDSATEQLDPIPPDNDDEEFDPDDLLLPPCPCLIGLAIVLMELHKGASLTVLSEVYDIPLNDETDLAARFIIARELFRCCKHEFTDQTRMAITACLDPNIGFDDDGENLDDIGMQNVIYEQIVCRLEDELEHGFKDVKLDQLDDLVQRLDLAAGGQPMREAKNFDAARSTLTSILTSSSHNVRLNRRVRFQSLSVDMTTETAADIAFSTARSHTLDKSELSKGQVESARNTMAANTSSIEVSQNLVVPMAPKKSPSDRPDTLRVLNIPDDMSESDLSIKLEQQLGWKCKVHSLARATRDAHWKQYATVTFPKIPNSELDKSVYELQQKELENAFEYDKKFLGLTPLYDAGEKATLDIIALEGLGTNPFGTFRAPHGDQMWLRDFLPESFPLCRILLYGYDSEVLQGKSDQKVDEIASTCKNVVANFRKMTKTDGRPIIWLGQSMGGLIVQEVLVLAHQHRSQRTSGNLSDRTIGFLGYGVPMNGLRNESLLNAVKNQPNFELIRSICLEDGRPSHYLESLANRFAPFNEKLSVHHFYETNPSPDNWNLEAMAERRVDDKGVIGCENRYWVPRNHRDLVKVPSKSDFVYMTTVEIISLIIENQLADAS